MSSLAITISYTLSQQSAVNGNDQQQPGLLDSHLPVTPKDDNSPHPNQLTVPGTSADDTTILPGSLRGTPRNFGEMLPILSLPNCGIKYVDSYKDGLLLQDQCPISQTSLEQQLKAHFKHEQTPFVFALVETKPTSEKDPIIQRFYNAIALQKGLQQETLTFKTDCKVHYFIINELPTTEAPSPIHYIATCATLQMASQFDCKNPTITVQGGYDLVDQYIQKKDYLEADNLFQYLRTISTIPPRFACFQSSEINERTAKQYVCKRTCETTTAQLLALTTGCIIPFFTPAAASLAINLGINAYYLLHCLRSRLTKTRCITYLDPYISTAGIALGISNIANTILQFAEHIPFNAVPGINGCLSVLTVGTSICKKKFWRCRT